MAGVSSITRSSEWWSFKIPPILAVGYAYLLLTTDQHSPYVSVGLIFAVMTSIIAVAAYGYVINDCFDIEQDRLAGKSNSMANRSVTSRLAILGLILGVGWLPAIPAGYSKLACVFLSIDFLLPTLYSIPPIRLKERGVFGVLADASAAHLLPVLLVSAVMIIGPEPLSLSQLILIVTTAAWYTLVGLRGIIDHQLVDREADIKSGVVTLATARGMIRVLKWIRRVLYVLEMISFAALVVILGMSTYSVFPVILIFGSLEIIKRLVGWVERDPSGGKRLYLPFANNIVYSLWLPIALSVEIGIRYPLLFWLPILHLVLFSRGRKHDYAELYRLGKDFFRKLRRIYNQRVYGWDVFADHSLWPRLSVEGSKILRVIPNTSVAAQNPWDVRLISNRYPLAAGMSYQLRLRIRSDQPRELTVGVCQRFPTFRDLGLAEVIPVSQEWEDFFFDFTATFTEQSAGIFIWLGGRDIPVEIEEAKLVCVTTPGPWRLMLTRPNEAWRSRPEDQTYLVKIDRILSDGAPWKVKLTGCNYSVRKGRLYRVQVSVRSSGNRPLTFGVARSYTPFDVVGLCEAIIVQDDFQEFQGDFVAEQDESVNIFFWLGGANSAVEVLSADLREISVSRLWTLRRKDGCYAWRVATDDPERVVVEVGERSGVDPHQTEEELAKASWDVTLRTPIAPIQAGNWYRVILGIRAIEERKVTLAVCQGDEPWDILGLCERVTLSQESKEFIYDFQAINSDHHPTFTVAIGENSSLVEIGSLEFEPVDPSKVWRLSVDQNCHACRQRGSRVGAIRVDHMVVDGVASHVQVLSGRTTIQKGNAYRTRLAIRSSVDRMVTYGVSQTVPPFDNAGVFQKVRLQANVIREFESDFVASRDDEVEIFVWLGAEANAIEVLSAGILPRQLTRRWSIQHKETHGVWRLASKKEDEVRVEIVISDDESIVPSPWDVTISTQMPALKEGSWYRLVFDASANFPREATFTVCQSYAPWEQVGFFKVLPLNNDSQRFAFDFQATKSELDSVFRIAVGEVASEIKVSNVDIDAIAESDVWHWNNSTPNNARYFPIRSGTIRIDSIVTDKKTWSVQLTGLPRHMHLGESYRWTCRFRADSERSIAFGTRQSVAPYQVIGLWREMKIGLTDEEVSIEFTMPSDDPSMIPFILLGDSDVPVELSDFSLQMISSGPSTATSINFVESAANIDSPEHDPTEQDGIDVQERDPRDEENAVREG